MSKIIMLKGLPGSGKSSWATSTVKEWKGMYKRVNKDDLRAMLDISEWSPYNEEFVLKIRDQIVIEALRARKNVIVDDTNFEPKHEARLRELSEIMRAGFEIKEFNATVDQCVERDMKRANPVGEKVINRMHQKYLQPVYEKIIQDPSLPMAIICDIDGTLALKGDRSPYDMSRVKEDKVNTPVEDVLFTYERQAEIILLSGRDGIAKRDTEEWLAEKGITYSKLYMRAAGDKRPDFIVKKELFDAHVKNKYRVLFILDDRNQVVRLWRGMGLTCFQVADGAF